MQPEVCILRLDYGRRLQTSMIVRVWISQDFHYSIAGDNIETRQ